MRAPALGGLEALRHVRRMGTGVAARALGAQAWSVKRELELGCALAERPPVPRAKVPVTMLETDPRAFGGFAEELELAGGTEYGQALRRVLVCRAGIRGLHVAHDEDGSPVYAQWLLDRAERDRLRRRLPGPWRQLGSDELMVEFAYTFARHRGKGAMAAGMGALLEIASGHGASTVYTYVRPDNVPSLRGCAKVGFAPLHMVSTSFRLGFHRVHSVPPDPDVWTQWELAVAPRRPPSG